MRRSGRVVRDRPPVRLRLLPGEILSAGKRVFPLSTAPPGTGGKGIDLFPLLALPGHVVRLQPSGNRPPVRRCQPSGGRLLPLSGIRRAAESGPQTAVRIAGCPRPLRSPDNRCLVGGGSGGAALFQRLPHAGRPPGPGGRNLKHDLRPFLRRKRPGRWHSQQPHRKSIRGREAVR